MITKKRISDIRPRITSADIRRPPTSAPWEEIGCEVRAIDGSAICEILARPEDTDRFGNHHADANSRVICAAPDLLAALELAISVIGDSHSHIISQGRAAIAKAVRG